MNNKPIGIFDSGVGGLTVLREITELLPNEDIIYLGDTARVPYGIRSSETVKNYAFECVDFLMTKDIKILVIACNTVSATALNEIKNLVNIPVIGVIEPGAISAVRITKNKKIGVIGTEATIKSEAYTKAIKFLDNKVEVFGLACPLLVPLVEEGWTEGIIAKLIVEKYLKDMMDKEIDTLVLGCTHYPLLKDVIQEVMGEISLVDSAIETAKVVRDKLKSQESGFGDLAGVRKGMIKFYVTDSVKKFVNIGERFLKNRIEDIEKINLGR
jgi:glutamate racemase